MIDDKYLIFSVDFEMRRRLVITFNMTCNFIKDYLNKENISQIIDKGRSYCDDERKARFLEYCHCLPIHDIIIASKTRIEIEELFKRSNFYYSIIALTPEKLRLYIDDTKEKKLIFG